MTLMAAIQATSFALYVKKDWSQWKLGSSIRILTVAYKLPATSCQRHYQYVGGITRGQHCRGENGDDSMLWILCSTIVATRRVSKEN